MSGKVYRVALVGTFDLKNYGDILFPDVFRSEMARLAPEVETVLFSPVGGEKPFEPGTWVYPVRELDKVHRETPLDAVVIGGGDLIRLDPTVVERQEKYEDRGRVTDLWVLPILFARMNGLPVLFNVPGVPYDFREDRARALMEALLSRLDYLAVRDEPSARALLLRDLPAPRLVPDTVVCVDDCYTSHQLAAAFEEIARANALPEEFALLQLNGLERNMSMEDYACQVKRLEELAGCPVVFMPIGYVHSDAEVMERLACACPGSRVIGGELSPMEMYALIGRAKCFVGTSMHGGLTAMVQQVPAVAVNYADIKKIPGCYAWYGMEGNVCRSLRDVTGEMLTRTAGRDRVAELQAQVRRHMADMLEIIRRGRTEQPEGCELLCLLTGYLPVADPEKRRCSIYFDCGTGFSEEHMLRVPGWVEEGKLRIEVEVPGDCARVRFDPVEGAMLAVERMWAAADGVVLETGKNNAVRVGERDVFFTPDPWYEIAVGYTARRLTIELDARVLLPEELAGLTRQRDEGQREALARLRQESEEEIDRLGREIEVLHREYTAAIAQRDGYIAQSNKLAMDIQLIHRSFSWRITAPIRAVTGALRKIPHLVLAVRAVRYFRRHGLRATLARVKDHRARVRRHKALLAWERQWKQEKGGLVPPPAFGMTPEEYEAQCATVFPREIKFSILVPLYNTPEGFLREMIASVQHQTYGNWELCLADGSDDEHANVGEICRELAQADGRIKYEKLERNLGISGNTNACIAMATGDYIALFDHDDLLHPGVLFEDMKAICEQDADFIYTDENTFHDEPKDAFMPHLKPDFAPDTLRANNYICHFTVFSRELQERVGLFRPECDGSQDFDMMLRLTEQARKIVHIPKILYYWRAHKGSVASDVGAKPYVIEAAHKAVSDHLERVGLPGQVLDSAVPSMYRLSYDIPEKDLVSIIICTKDHIDDLKKCVDSILEKTTYPNYEIIIVENNSTEPETFAYYEVLERHERIRVVTWKSEVPEFNYSAVNNFGVTLSKGKYVLLLNNDTEVITPNWLEEMVMYAQRSDVGAVGVKLIYPDETIQHAGLGIGLLTLAGHYHRNFPRSHPGYMGRLSYAHNVSGVTAACVMLRRDVWEQVGGLDETFKVAFNDVDLCMRVRQAGYLIVFTPFAELYHYESKSRGLDEAPEKRARFVGEVERFQKRWAKELAAGDPYYNPNFSLDSEDFTVRPECLL